MLTGGIDLWALAGTVEVSEPTQRQLEEILDAQSITLLTLDWTDTGLPPLAMLLAAVSALGRSFGTAVTTQRSGV